MASQEDLTAAAVKRPAAEGAGTPPAPGLMGDQQKGYQQAGDASDPGLSSALSTWWETQLALFGDMVALAASEAKFAAVGLAQLLVGVVMLIILATLALVCLQIAIAAGLYAIALPVVVIALLLFGLNVITAVIIYRKLKPLPENFKFEHTRNMVKRRVTATSVTPPPKA